MSLDPRIKRVSLSDEVYKIEKDKCWTTFQVFHQKKTGAQHAHVGSVHAPTHEIAMIFAKEQFGRRLACVNMWVVKTTDVFSMRHEDADIFHSATSQDKKYRDASGFKVREKINAFKNRNK
tara:strand:- start:148 stop:510 length:363 start_codon:yes stop_codon:yes gene_type:complete